MQTLIFNEDKASVRLFPDSTNIDIGSDRIYIDPGTANEYHICGMNTENSTLIKDVSEPTEWVAWKYIYDGEWKNNHPLDDGKTYKYTAPVFDELGRSPDYGWTVVE